MMSPQQDVDEIREIEWDVYERFHVVTKPAPHRRSVPHPFYPVINKIGLTKYLLRELKEVKWRLITSKKHREAFFTKPCIYGVFSGPLAGYKPRRHLCTGCLRCVLEYPEFCTVERNPAFYEFGDSYWIPRDLSQFSTTPASVVWKEAETGKIPIKGMGYKGPFARDGWDEIWTDMSEIVRPTRDGIYGREYISTLVDLGRKPKYLEFSPEGKVMNKARTVQASLPILLDYLPPNLSNSSIYKSIAGAAEHVKTFFVMRPEDMEKYRISPSRWMIPLVDSSSMRRHDDLLSRAPMIELITTNPSDVEYLRGINSKAPVLVRMNINRDVNTLMKDLLQSPDGACDGFHLVADYHGREFEDEQPRFIKDALQDIHLTLVREGLRDEITIIASGGMIIAEHVPKAIIMGADAVAIDTTILVALQMRFKGECRHPRSSSIVKEQVDTNWGRQRLINLLGSWHDQLIEILSAMGQRDVRRLRGDIGRAMFRDELEMEAFGDIDVVTE